MLLDKPSKSEETLNELEHIKKTMCMLNFGTMALEHILEMGKRTNDHAGLRFKGEISKTNPPSPTEAA